MAQADFSIRADGARWVERRLGRLLTRLGDLLPLMETLGAFLESTTRHRFETGIAPDGRAWKPSLRATLEGGQTLVKDGHLRDSITYLASNDRVEVGSNKIYAAVHQLGATIRPVQANALHFQLPGGLGFVTAQQVIIPARPYLGISGSDVRGVERLVDRYAEAALA